MNNVRRLLESAIIWFLWAGVTPSAFSSATGIMTFASPMPGSDRASRQIVRMEGAGGRLSGAPVLGPIALIVVEAPACAPADIVLRETVSADNRTLIRLLLPACMRENLVKATLYLRREVHCALAARPGGDGWIECRGRMLPLPVGYRLHDSGPPVPALVTHDLGVIELSGAVFLANTPPRPLAFWTVDQGARLGRAAWHILWSMIALAAFVALSWSVHKASLLKCGGQARWNGPPAGF